MYLSWMWRNIYYLIISMRLCKKNTPPPPLFAKTKIDSFRKSASHLFPPFLPNILRNRRSKMKDFFCSRGSHAAIPPSFPIFPAPPNILRASRNDFFAKRKWVSCHLFVKGGGVWVSPAASEVRQRNWNQNRSQTNHVKKGNSGNSFSVQKHGSFFPCLFSFFSAVFFTAHPKKRS